MMPTATRNGTRTPHAPEPVDKASIPVVAEIGVTGLKHDQGVIREEWVRALDGPNGARVYEEMQLDPIVGAMLWAIYTELRRVGYDVEAADETPEAEDAADFVRGCLEDMSSPFEDVIAEALTMLPFGWSYHEIVYKVRRGHVPGKPGQSSQFSDGLLGWRKLPIRAQETLRRWEMDDEGGIAGMVQVIDGAPDVTIPVEKALLFRPDAHKNNPQGRSVLRSSYPAWYLRRRLQEFEAIGIERDLVGIPKIGVPAEWLAESATSAMTAAVAAYRRIGEQARNDEQACLIWPRSLDANGNELITFELLASPGAKQTDIGPVVQRYNTEILMTLMADVILVGHNATGTFALATQKYRAFERSLEAFMRSIAAVFNRHAIPRLLQLNEMDPELAPKICFADIEDQDLDVLGKFLTALYGAGVPLFPNQELEAWLFRAAGMPWTPPDDRPEDALPKPAPVAPTPPGTEPEPDADPLAEDDPAEEIDTGDQPVSASPVGKFNANHSHKNGQFTAGKGGKGGKSGQATLGTGAGISSFLANRRAAGGGGGGGGAGSSGGGGGGGGGGSSGGASKPSASKPAAKKPAASKPAASAGRGSGGGSTGPRATSAEERRSMTKEANASRSESKRSLAKAKRAKGADDDELLEAHENYLADGSFPMNRRARGNPKPGDDNRMNDRHIANLDKAFDTHGATNKAPMLAYRGVPEGVAGKLSGLKPGDVVKDAGYMSTTTARTVAKDFTGGSKGAVMEIHVPAGKKSLAGTDYEKELVFPKGSALKYLGKGGDGAHQFEMV